MSDSYSSSEEQAAKIEYLTHRNGLMNFILVNEADYQSRNRRTANTPREIAARFFARALKAGLRSGVFRPDGDLIIPAGLPQEMADGMKVAWDDAIPWSVVTSVAEEFGVDADAIRKEVGEAIMSAGGFPAEVMELAEVLKGAESTLSPQEAREMVWEKRTKGRYILHCRHDDHPCEHVFDDVESAVQEASIGLRVGTLQSVEKITKDDALVIGQEELDNRIDMISSIRNN